MKLTISKNNNIEPLRLKESGEFLNNNVKYWQ